MSSPEKGTTMSEPESASKCPTWCKLDGPHWHDEASNVPSLAPARVARYAEAIASADTYPTRPEAWHVEARAVIRVADSELAAKDAEIERLKRGGAELGKIVKRHCDMVLDATGLHDWIDEDGDGDWAAVWENLAALRPRAEAAEAKVAKVEALHQPFECSNARCRGNGLHCRTCDEGYGANGEHVYYPCPTIRALADAPARVAPPGACPPGWMHGGVQGEFYPCKPDIFEATYEAQP